MKKITLLVLATVLCGCSGIGFSTNFGSYATNKVKVAGVREYSLEEISQYDASSLGFIDASSCQEKPDDREPSRKGLVSELKLRAQRLGGNGIVVEACGTAAAAMCQRYMECRAVAYLVPERKGVR